MIDTVPIFIISCIRSGPVTTTYTYDAASRLVTAQADATAWHYVYDKNGSLVQYTE